MTVYIGPLGGLIAIDCPSSLVSTLRRAFRNKVTTSGVVKTQVSPRTSREWSLAWGSATVAEIAGLAALASGEFGYGPFWFADPWAQVTNLLHPRAAALTGESPAGMTIGGPVTLADGSRAGRSWVVANPAMIHHVNYLDGALHRIPCVAGTPVCGSVFASGGGNVEVRLQWYDAASNFLSNTAYRSHTPGGSMQRLWQTGNPPSGAHSFSTQVRGANRIARPAVTWTPSLIDWYVGQGSFVMLPTELSQDIEEFNRGQDKDDRLATVSSIIREVS